MRKFSAVVIVE